MVVTRIKRCDTNNGYPIATYNLKELTRSQVNDICSFCVSQATTHANGINWSGRDRVVMAILLWEELWDWGKIWTTRQVADALVEHMPQKFSSSSMMAYKFVMSIVKGSTGFVRVVNDCFQIDYKAIAEKTGIEFIPGEWEVRRK